jgi:DMSO/TMAO reductase YedYZ molybdopterin-dependent catalytic subunit
MNHTIDRRGFLRTGGLAWLALIDASALGRPQSALDGGRLLGTLTLGGEGGQKAPPLGQVLGTGLDARLFTDLSTLTADTLITPSERFFVRTACPPTLPGERPWTIDLGGLVRAPRVVVLDSVVDLVRPIGTHLLECAGNSNPTSFGLMSAARWEGIPLGALIDRVTPQAPRARIEVSGIDDLTQRSRTSVPGASWIFSRDDLERAGAFLATRMNGAPLPRDHGFPARLVVPGWYGCACIKWVNRIDLVADTAAATTQMVEFAGRTHQDGQPALAREFTPAVIDSAAMPVRVEKWTVGGRIVYRIVGVLWGGSASKRPTNALMIRFKTNQSWVPVDDCPMPATSTTWSLWSHLWRPEAPGRYQIVLRVNDPAVRTRRLDVFFYTREVWVQDT